jgi:hypothetical protein
MKPAPASATQEKKMKTAAASGAINGAAYNPLPIDRSNRLGDLAARIAAEHEAAGAATRKTLQHAITAGELLIEAKDRVGHGRWENWLKKTCNVPPRSATNYMKLAEGREILEKNQIGIAADLTIRAALRLLKPKTKKAESSDRPKKKPATERILSSLTWSDAPQTAQTSFVDAVGLQALYAAAPPDHQAHFRAWLLQKQAPAVEQSHPEMDAQIPEDLSIPDFLKRERVPETVS